MAHIWLLLVAFILWLGAMPKITRRYKKQREFSDLLELLGGGCLAVAIVCYLLSVLL